jgi:methylenetetrahydrofolate dehydrogenase (NADP+) / methenyltetrahydrofolate cyclohydrolase
MPASVIDGKKIASEVRARVAAECRVFTAETGITPQLTAVLVGDDPASAVYVRNKHQACQQAGLRSTVVTLPADIPMAALRAEIDRLNHDREVHGILVQLPLPAALSATEILDRIDPLKDVDAFHPENVGRLCQGRPRFVPCTPHGVMMLLEYAGISTAGKRAVVVGRSDIVGKPLALLLSQKGADATVTLCHSQTPHLAAVTREAELLIAAIGRPEFITADMVRPGAVVIDVGINRTAEGRLVGDVDFASVSQVASQLTPVPGGVGPMTIAMLLHNTLIAARWQSRYPTKG